MGLFRWMLNAALQNARAGVTNAVETALTGVDLHVADAMQYAVVGGKCLRGFLVLEGARLHGVPDATPIAAAIECLHSYSLVHDDLPCMDDDAVRRGQPTVHMKWDEATAVLAGDALQSLAFDLIGNATISATARVDLMTSLATASGVRGMVGGQALDISAETAASPLTLRQITTLQAGKTGALITWSAMAGPRMADADTLPLKTYGDALGLAFQIADDILDVEGDAAIVGKAVGKDANAGKATFVSLLGLDAAKRRASALVEEACDALSPYGNDAETLRDAARYVITRDK
jgi:farnesyl diphosphate synthase